MALDSKKFTPVQVRRGQQYRGCDEEGGMHIYRSGERCYAPKRHLELFPHAIEPVKPVERKVEAEEKEPQPPEGEGEGNKSPSSESGNKSQSGSKSQSSGGGGGKS